MTGEPLKQLANTDLLNGNKLDYSLPFPIAMDKLIKNHEEVTEETVLAFIESQIPDFSQWPDKKKPAIVTKARNYLKTKTHKALTFECYQLQGTPSSILIDKKGILRDVSFGWANHLEPLIKDLLSDQAF